MHGGVSGAVSEDDDRISEPDGETGGDGTVGWMGQVICIYPYVPLTGSVPRPPHTIQIPQDDIEGKFWSDGYFVRSVGDKVTPEVIRRYIKYQHNEQLSFVF